MYHYIVIDCSSLCYANAYSLKGLRTNEIETNVIFGFLNSLLTLSESFKTNKFLFCWDSKISWREEIFPEYKVKRKLKKKEASEEDKAFYHSMGRQVRKLREEMLPFIGFKNSFMHDGIEADDIIADLVIGYDNCLMVTNDEDLYQMLGYADQYKTSTETIISKDKFIKEYGITPEQWVDVKCIGGCKSDEIPGAPGVGETRAIKYIKGKLKSTTKAFESIKKSSDIIKRNRKLVKLPIKGTPEFTVTKDCFSIDNLLQLADQYWIDSYRSKVGIARWENFFNRKPLCLNI